MSEITRDRRELWHLESFLTVNGTTDAHRDRQQRLRRYLNETCQHEEVTDVSGWGNSPKGTQQCSLCCRVWLPGEPGPAASDPQATEVANGPGEAEALAVALAAGEGDPAGYRAPSPLRGGGERDAD